VRKLVVGTFMTLDGVVQAPGAPNEDQEGGFAHGGWTVPLFDDELGQRMVALTDRADALLLGRKTYEGFAASWPLVGDEDPIAAKLNRIPKYVVSRTLTTAAWANTTILSGDVAKEVAELREQPGGEIHVSGSGTLIQTLLRHDLVDEFVLVVLGDIAGEDGGVPGAGRARQAAVRGGDGAGHAGAGGDDLHRHGGGDQHLPTARSAGGRRRRT
jgi:dihydrofolate reductase